jgi:hypothetical protein
MKAIAVIPQNSISAVPANSHAYTGRLRRMVGPRIIPHSACGAEPALTAAAGPIR